MLRPSYTELMKVMNEGEDVDNRVTSRYTIVIAASKRARQIIDGATPYVPANADKAVSTAVKEMYEKQILVKMRPEEDEDNERLRSDKIRHTREQFFITDIDM